MPRDIDRYPFLSPTKRRAGSPEDVAAIVRGIWPGANQEGSTGFERSWTVRTPEGLRLVAHSWSPKASLDFFWVRIAATIENGVDDENMHNDPHILQGRRGR